jgi:hypothetical protein
MNAQIESRTLCSAAPAVFPLALGRMGMSGLYGRPDDNDSIATIHAVLARKETQLSEPLGDLEVTLSSADLSRGGKTLAASAVAGTRYDEH